MPTAISQVKSASMTAFVGTAIGNPAHSQCLDGPSRSDASRAAGRPQLEEVKAEEGKRAHPPDEDDRNNRNEERAGQAIVSYLIFPLHFFPLHLP